MRKNEEKWGKIGHFRRFMEEKSEINMIEASKTDDLTMI